MFADAGGAEGRKATGRWLCRPNEQALTGWASVTWMIGSGQSWFARPTPPPQTELGLSVCAGSTQGTARS